MIKNIQNSIPKIFNRKIKKYNYFKFNDLYLQIACEIANRIKETNLDYEYYSSQKSLNAYGPVRTAHGKQGQGDSRS